MQRIGEATYKLNLSEGCSHHSLCGIHDIFHVSLLRPHRNNRLKKNVLPIEVDSEVEFEVEKITKHRESEDKPST